LLLIDEVEQPADLTRQFPWKYGEIFNSNGPGKLVFEREYKPDHEAWIFAEFPRRVRRDEKRVSVFHLSTLPSTRLHAIFSKITRWNYSRLFRNSGI